MPETVARFLPISSTDSVFIKAKDIAFLQLMGKLSLYMQDLSVLKHFSNLSRVLWCVVKIIISYYHISIRFLVGSSVFKTTQILSVFLSC